MASGVRAGWLLGALVLCSLAGVGLSAGSIGAVGGPVHDAGAVTDTAVRTATLGADGPLMSVSNGTALQTERTIDVTQQFRLTPDRPGSYESVQTYELPEEVTGLDVTHGDRASVVDASGFERTGPGTYAWDGSTRQPSLTLRVAANETVTDAGPIGTGGEYRFVDVGEWALVRRPQVGHGWEWRGGDVSVGLDATTTVAGEGAVGGALVFLGPHETHSRSAHGQTVDLVVPERATLAERPDAIFESLFEASETLRVGDRDEVVFVIAAPTGTVDWGVRGVQTGDADAWVRDGEPLDDADSVWLHEYVHTRQEFRTTADARWLAEAGATYYATRLAHEQGRISFERFRETLARGTRERYANAVLSDQSTWEHDPDYPVGALATGELDRRTRRATDSAASFDRVVDRLNDHDGTVDGTAFLNHLKAVGGEGVAAAGRRYTTTSERPQPWNASQHGAAFGVTPARFAVALDGETPVAVGVPYRNRTLDGERPLVLVPGERVAASVGVENTGEAAGDFETALAVDGSPVDRASGRLGPGERTTRVLKHAFASTGTYTLSVADERVDVRVRDPAAPAVTAFSANRTELEPGKSVTLRIEVVNAADRPAAGTLAVTRNGRRFAERSVELDVGERETLTVRTVIDDAGESTFGLGATSDRTVTVVATDPFPTAPVVAIGGGVVTLVVLAVLTSWWRRRRGSNARDVNRLEP